MDEKLIVLSKKKLIDAENALKLVLGLRTKAHKEPVNYLDVFTWGKHTLNEVSLRLSRDEEELAFALLEHCTLYTIVIQIDTVLHELFKNQNTDRFNHPDSNVCSAAWIARLIRNAFAHDPLNPVWITYSECDSKMYAVEDIIELNTKGINGQRVRREHYGGPIAIILLSEYVRTNILED